METVHDLIIKNIEKYVCNTVVVECWMCTTGSNSEAENFQNFHKAMVTLYNYYLLLCNIFNNLELLCVTLKYRSTIYYKNSTEVLKVIFRSALLSQLPLDYKKSVRHFYEVGLKYEENRGTESLDELCSNCGSNRNLCICAQYFYEANRYIHTDTHFYLN